MNNIDAKKEINKRKDEAQKILSDEATTKRFVNDVEKKYDDLFKNKKTSVLSKKLSEIKEYVPLLISLVNSYLKKEYREIPIGTIIAVVATLIYFFSPIDIFPDYIPGIGYVDDAAVIAGCVLLLKYDLDEYKRWKTLNDNIVDTDVVNK